MSDESREVLYEHLRTLGHPTFKMSKAGSVEDRKVPAIGMIAAYPHDQVVIYADPKAIVLSKGHTSWHFPLEQFGLIAAMLDQELDRLLVEIENDA